MKITRATVFICFVLFLGAGRFVHAQAISSVDRIEAFPTQASVEFPDVWYDRVLFNVYIYGWAANAYPPCNLEIAYDDGTFETKRLLPSTSIVIAKPTVPADMTLHCDGKQASTRYNAVNIYYNGQRLPYQGDAMHIYIPSKVGDTNGDNLVDQYDYLVWKDYYLKQTSSPAHGNFNTDWITDGKDYILWLFNFGS